MPLFRRDKQPEPDGALPLDRRRADRLRDLARQAFASQGVAVEVRPDHVVDGSGQQYFLWNIAANLASQPDAEWLEVLTAYAASVIAPDDPDALGVEELRAATYLRIQPDDAIFDPVRHPTAPSPAPGLRTLLAVDLPTTVSIPDESWWADRGEVADWREVGLRNLAGLVGRLDFELLRMAEENYDFRVLMGDSFFTASLALQLPAVLAAYDQGADASRGVLVAMPFRHQLAWRALDSPTAIPTVNALAGFAVNGESDGAGPVSPHVYFVREGRWQQLTRRAPDGSLTVEVTAEFQEALESLVG